ncbi:MAG TPA: Trm112 family protein [Candidatus Nanoarchaeia archaeon]|nr:Trm112 family protein [Candidatus Nanoarchaeia archaeon]
MNKELLDILACPKCKGNLNYNKTKLSCKKCKKDYKIKEGIPIFI